MADRARPDAETYLDTGDELVTGEAVALDVRAAPFLLRAAGAAIDVVVYFLAYGLLMLLLSNLAVGGGVDQAAQAALAIIVLVICIVVAPLTVELLTRGRSLGKLAIGARVVRDDGGAIGFRQAFVRALAGVLELYLTFGGLAALFALLNGRSRRMGDLLAGTYAQNERVGRPVPQGFGVPSQLEGWARIADVARLPDRLARRISQFLLQAPRLTSASRARLARELAIETAPYVSPLPPVDPELYLAAVTVVRRRREAAALELEQQRLDRLAPALTGTPNGFPDRG